MGFSQNYESDTSLNFPSIKRARRDPAHTHISAKFLGFRYLQLRSRIGEFSVVSSESLTQSIRGVLLARSTQKVERSRISAFLVEGKQKKSNVNIQHFEENAGRFSYDIFPGNT
jgi:hypothetical protein